MGGFGDRVAWRASSQGRIAYDRSLTIVASTDSRLVGRQWNAFDGIEETYAADVEHVRRFGGQQTVRRLWQDAVWESTFSCVNGCVTVQWKRLYEIPADAALTMTRLLSVVRLVSEALEGGDPHAPAAPAAPEARRSASSPRLRAV